jgi:hypothetical protein
LPLNLAATAGDVLASLREYREAAPDLVELRWLIALAENFRAAAESLAAKTPTDRAQRNALLLRVARLVNPVLHHARSDFDFDLGRTSRMLPGLAPALTLATLSPDAAHMAKIVLRRQANRIAHSLLRAEETIRHAIGG